MPEWVDSAIAIGARVLAAIGGMISGLYGGWGGCMNVLLVSMIVDYLSGVIVALLGKSANSPHGGLSAAAGWKGLVKKGMMLLVVLVAALLDSATGSDNNMFRNAVCWFYIANECISILKNASLAGVPWPKALTKILHGMQEKTETLVEEDSNETGE